MASVVGNVSVRFLFRANFYLLFSVVNTVSVRAFLGHSVIIVLLKICISKLCTVSCTFIRSFCFAHT